MNSINYAVVKDAQPARDEQREREKDEKYHGEKKRERERERSERSSL